MTAPPDVARAPAAVGTAVVAIRPADRRFAWMRMLAALTALIAAIALVLPVVQLRFARLRKRGERVLAPLGEGEASASPSGSGAQLIVVDATPEGSQVEIDTILEGETPMSTELHCAPGSQVEVVVKHAGYKPYKLQIACAPGTIVNLAPKLSRR